MEEVPLTWGAIVFFIGLSLTIGVPVIKLNVSIAKLTEKLETLTGDLNELSTQNTTAHTKLVDRLDEHESTLNNHETRISILEHDKE